ncbi:MAG: putative zinc-binding metallopeptidase [Deltaproteobacteria bacterium]|nr:putative zinc-binding metallopeptidase [Deltaproteobacteria bacterium]
MRLTRTLLWNADTRKTELLHTPVNALPLGWEEKGNILGRCITQVMKDVQHFGVTLNPTFYLSDAYGCVEGTTNIGLGFWDADQDLREIRRDVKEQMRDEADLVLLLKHEVGHAFCYAYKLYRLKEFRQLFQVEGNYFRSYPDGNTYKPDPFSKDFVNPDYDHYAQKHPDDDFAETFSVVVDPAEAWRGRYGGRPGALRKLTFVLRLIKQYSKKKPLLESDSQPLHMPVSDIKQTVAEFFHISRRRYLAAAEGFMDPELLQIFAKPDRLKSETITASLLVARSRVFIEQVVKRRANIKDKHLVSDILDKINERVRDLGLVYRQRDEARVLAELLALVLIKARNFALFNTFRNHMS